MGGAPAKEAVVQPGKRRPLRLPQFSQEAAHEKSAAERLNRLGFLDGDGSGGLLWRTVERLAYFATRLGASGLGGALLLAPVVALFLALFLAFAVKALAHNLQRLFGRKKRRRRKTD